MSKFLFDSFEQEGEEFYLPEDECCLCCSTEGVTCVSIQQTMFGFCGNHAFRATFLQRGKLYGFPDLHINGITGRYATTNSPGWWVIIAVLGTDECIAELLDALDEYEASQDISA